MKKVRHTLSVATVALAALFTGGLSARAADAAFEADSARMANLLKEPQKGGRLLWMRKSPFVAESGKLAEQRTLAKSLLARIDNDNNPFAMAMYILAVALTTFFTSAANTAINGTASNKFILGVSNRFSVPGLSKIPWIGGFFTNMYPFEIIIIVLVIFFWYLMNKTR